MTLVLPANGAWVAFHVRGATPSETVTAAVLEVREDRTGGVPLAKNDGIVLGRYGIHSKAGALPVPGTAAIVEITETEITLDDYITWTPTKATVRLATPNSLGSPLTVLLRNATPAAGAGPRGRILFGPATPSGGPPPATAFLPTISLALPPNGTRVSFYVAGEFGFPSLKDKDAIIEVFDPAESDPQKKILESIGLMVRIRKNANTLTDLERGRFVQAVWNLHYLFNGYVKYPQIYSDAGSRHHSSNKLLSGSRPAFLPWHRLFILAFERELQAINPTVTLPYWRYDQPAPNVFTPAFMGVSQTGSSPWVITNEVSNPLSQFAWRMRRQSTFKPGQAPSGHPACTPLAEAGALALGSKFHDTGPGGTTTGFMAVEWLAHDIAVQAAAGDCAGNWSTAWLAQQQTAARDPLFFLLTANTDRLWAKWQRQAGRSDATVGDSYGTFPCDATLARCLTDKIWPWGVPSTAWNRFPEALGKLRLPPSRPSVADAISLDRGYMKIAPYLDPGLGLGYSYDDTQPTS
jgi:tyrosinase